MGKSGTFYIKSKCLSQQDIDKLFIECTGKDSIEKIHDTEVCYTPTLFFMNDSDGNIALYVENTAQRQFNLKDKIL